MVDLSKLLELMESKDKKNLDQLGGVTNLAHNLGSDVQGGLKASTVRDLAIRKEQYGVNQVDRKPPPSILKLFLEAMKDTTIIILLFAAGDFSRNISNLWFCRIQSNCALVAISIIFGLVICFVHLGVACPRRPLWDVGDLDIIEVLCI